MTTPNPVVRDVMAAAGTTVLAERYVLADLLGSGGMADVYRATDLVLERDVAVKVLRSTTADANARARFTSEARTLAALGHRGIVTLLDAGAQDEHHYLVMELIAGPTLASHLREAGPLDRDRLRSLGTQLADALAYAHGRGVVHRDVKPGNVLFRPDGSAVLTDFGIARLLTEAAQHTRTGEVIGSPAYLSPEQVRGAVVGTSADVYSLGLILLEAGTGVRAYPGPPVEAAIARLSTPPAMPVSLGRGLRDLMTQMTALSPEDRPTAAEVAVALLATEVDQTAIAPEITTGPFDPVADTGTAVLTAPPDPSVSVPAPPRRRTGLLIAAAVAAIVLAITGLTQLRPDRATAEPTTPSATPTTTPSAPRPTAAATPVTVRTPRPPAIAKPNPHAAKKASKAKARPHAKATKPRKDKPKKR